MKAMKSKILMLLAAVMAMVGMSSCEKVDAGHEGVGDVSMCTGMVWSYH